LSVRAPGKRLSLVALAVVLCSLALAACGGGSVSVAVPKSTPELTPPNDTSAEKAALQTTATSTTTTKSKTTSTSESAESEPEGSSESESGAGEGEATPSGGTAGEEKAPEKASKTEEGTSSPTGGASAP
jgi:hypothetical protein